MSGKASGYNADFNFSKPSDSFEDFPAILGMRLGCTAVGVIVIFILIIIIVILIITFMIVVTLNYIFLCDWFMFFSMMTHVN